MLPVVTLTWVGELSQAEKETAGPREGLLGSTGGRAAGRGGECSRGHEDGQLENVRAPWAVDVINGLLSSW